MFNVSNAKQQGGMEMMLRAAGLGQVLDMANALAASGTIDKILNFADQLSELQKSIQAMRVRQELMLDKLVQLSRDLEDEIEQRRGLFSEEADRRTERSGQVMAGDTDSDGPAPGPGASRVVRTAGFDDGDFETNGPD